MNDITWSDDDIATFDDAYLDELAGHGSWNADVTAHIEHQIVDARPAPEQPERPKTLTVRQVHDALDHPPGEPPSLIDGFLRLGEITVMGGSRAVGKSWAVNNVAKLLCDGEGRLFGQLEVRRKAKVLIAQGEVSPWASWNRWRIIYGDQRPDSIGETFDRWRIRVQKRRSSGTDRETGASWADEWFEPLIDPRLEQTIAEDGYDLLVVDPWATYYGGKANDNDEAEMALAKLWEIARRHKIAVLIMLHVSGKIDSYNKEPEDLWRGATRVADSATTRVTMIPHYSEKQAKSLGMSRMMARQHLDLHFLNRDTAPIDGFSIKRDVTSGMFDRWIDPREADREEDGGVIRGYNPVDLAEACPKEGWPSLKVMAADMNCSMDKAKRHGEVAAAAGYLERFTGPNGGQGYRPVSPKLELVREPAPAATDEIESF